jgi:hypothetical protein
MWRSTLDDVIADAMRDVLELEEDDDLRTRAAKVLAFPEITGLTSAERNRSYVDTVQSLLDG